MSGLSPTTPGHHAGIDVDAVRRDFPALAQEVHGHRFVYLDNAATAQKPQQVIDAIRHYYEHDNANVHRGVHELSQRATDAYEAAREKSRAFLGAAEAAEIVFVRGATEGINLVASSWGGANLGRGDEVLITGMEHHSNIVPWQIICEKTGAKLRVVPITGEGEVDADAYGRLLNDRTAIVAFTHVSNALGTVNPAKEMIERAHAEGAITLVDGAQAAPHLPVDVRELDCDFYVFSSHKAYGPTGIGVLYGKRELLEEMPPYQGGGDMISSVRFEKTVYNKVPHKFEAGTPNIAGVIGMGAAIDYLTGLGMEAVEAHEEDVVAYAVDMLRAVEGVTLVGTPAHRAGAISFSIQGVHPHDAGTIIDREGVAIRAGHHCSQPVMDFYGVPATNRASFGIYNTRADADCLALAVRRVQEVFGS